MLDSVHSLASRAALCGSGQVLSRSRRELLPNFRDVFPGSFPETVFSQGGTDKKASEEHEALSCVVCVEELAFRRKEQVLAFVKGSYFLLIGWRTAVEVSL